jgi:hypothetical protein
VSEQQTPRILRALRQLERKADDRAEIADLEAAAAAADRFGISFPEDKAARLGLLKARLALSKAHSDDPGK